MSRTVRFPALVSLVVAACLAAPAEAQPRYPVFLANGAQIIATSRPIIAMGLVSFLDESHRAATIPVAKVDVKATRQAAGAPPRPKAPANVPAHAGGVGPQYYDDALPDPAALTEDGKASPLAKPAPAGEVMTTADRLRAQIDGIGAKVKDLPTSNRERSMLVIQQLELQEELSRILTAPVGR